MTFTNFLFMTFCHLQVISVCDFLSVATSLCVTVYPSLLSVTFCQGDFLSLTFCPRLFVFLFVSFLTMTSVRAQIIGTRA